MSGSKGGWIPDLAPLDKAAGRTLDPAEAKLLFFLAAEYAEPTPHRDVRKRAEQIEKLAGELQAALADAPGALESLDHILPADTLDKLADHARHIGDTHAGMMGKGKRPASEDTMLEQIAFQALTAWHNAGGKGLGVYWSTYQGGRTGPVLDLICEALALAGARQPSEATVQRAAEAASQP